MQQLLIPRGSQTKKNQSIPRNHKPKGQEFHDGIYVTIIGSCENGLEQLDK